MIRLLILPPQLVIFFGGKEPLQQPEVVVELQAKFPAAYLIGGSTSGEIIGDEVLDDSVVATAIEFEHTSVEMASMNIHDAVDSLVLGQQLAKQLPLEGLNSVFVLSDGHLVNGSLLVKGLISILGETTILTGGLAGDGDRFEETLVCANSALESGRVGVVGFYGESLLV
ncbi:MAG: FIST N-terminal domain-containing protein, partial [Bacteroidota bacterium]